ncbi:hypothetical protein D3C86_1483920 [compost metagenome]
MFKHRLTMVAVPEAAGSVAEIGVMTGFVDGHVVGKTKRHATSLGGQRDQPTLGIQR